MLDRTRKMNKRGTRETENESERLGMAVTGEVGRGGVIPRRPRECKARQGRLAEENAGFGTPQGTR